MVDESEQHSIAYVTYPIVVHRTTGETKGLLMFPFRMREASTGAGFLRRPMMAREIFIA